MLFVNASHPQHHRLEQLSCVYASVLPRSSADALFAVTHPPIVLDVQPQSAEGKSMHKCCLMVFPDWLFGILNGILFCLSCFGEFSSFPRRIGVDALDNGFADQAYSLPRFLPT